MSGHNKWSKIKHKKGAKDAERGKVFTKLGKAITIAASEGGGDPDMNFSLRLVIDKAKAVNMPNDNIERAIKKGTGEIAGGQITRISYEAFGPLGSALIIDCSTDNTNRTIADVRNLLEKNGGKMADAGSVAWQFAEKGQIIIKPAKLKKAEKYGAEDTYEAVDKDDLMLELLEVEGIEDIKESTTEDDEGIAYEIIEIYTERNEFARVDGKLREINLEILSSELIKLPNEFKELTSVEGERIQNFIDELEENEDVENVWINVNY